MSQEKTSARTPPERTAKILDVVRLVPRTGDLPDFWAPVYRRLADDPGGLFSFLREAYDIGADEVESVLYSKNPDEYWKEWGVDDDQRKHRSNFRKDWSLAENTYSRQVLLECINGLPSEFVNYIDLPQFDLEGLHGSYCRHRGEDISIKDFCTSFASTGFDSLVGILTLSALGRYSDAREWYRRLYAMMDFLQKVRTDSNFDLNTYYGQVPLFALEKVSVVENRITFVPDTFTEAFNNIDIDRLRLCENERCGKVFWLRRLPRKNWTGRIGCSKACSGALRTRHWRERTTDAQRVRYKINRIEKELNQK